MELSPSWEAVNCAATQELPSILWNPKVHLLCSQEPDNTIHSVNNSFLLRKRVTNLTQWSKVLLKLLWLSKVKKSHSIYGIPMSVRELERARHSFIYCSRRIQTIPSCSLRLTSCLLIYYSTALNTNPLETRPVTAIKDTLRHSTQSNT
jgi:hypothetical protein